MSSTLFSVQQIPAVNLQRDVGSAVLHHFLGRSLVFWFEDDSPWAESKRNMGRLSGEFYQKVGPIVFITRFQCSNAFLARESCSGTRADLACCTETEACDLVNESLTCTDLPYLDNNGAARTCKFLKNLEVNAEMYFRCLLRGLWWHWWKCFQWQHYNWSHWCNHCNW